MHDPEDARPIIVNTVSAELMLQTALACQRLSDAVDHIDMLISDGETRENVVRRVRRIDALYRLVPFILDPRRIVTLCDHAAGHPEWWQVNRLHFFMPELTLRQLADITGLENFQVREALKNVEITDDCYKKLPKMEETKWI